MTKSDLIERITRKFPQVSRKDIEVMIDIVFDGLTEALRIGDRIEIRGFGSFHIRTRKAREGRNPKTGQMVSIPEKKIPFFKVGKTLKDRLNAPVQSSQETEAVSHESSKTEEQT